MNFEPSYKSNSNNKNKAMIPKEKVEKVIKGTVKTSKNKFYSIVENIASNVLSEVIIPSFKKVVSDVVRDGIDVILYGEARGKKSSSYADRVSYRSYYDTPVKSSGQSMTYVKPSYNDIVLSSRHDAEEVLFRMDELIKEYGLVRIGDLYDLVGMSTTPTDNNYGWTNIQNASIVHARDGYQIKMPRAIPLD